MSVSLPCIGEAFHYYFYSHIFAFALVVGRTWKTKLAQQWIYLLMES